MYQAQNYYQPNLGVAGHRSGNYMLYQHRPNPFYSTYQQPVYDYPPFEAHHPANAAIPVIPAPVEATQPVNGGINSVLQYDLNTMSTFLSWCAFGMLKQTRNPTAEFEGFVVSVLFATRLPKSTIIIALEYMNQRFSSNPEITDKSLTEHEIFIYLIVALILANKFNDDNTFTNKSWSGATSLPLAMLNSCEMKWLEECKWSLNVVKFESNILTLEQCWKTWLEKYDKSEAEVEAPVNKNSATSPIRYQSGYNSSPGYRNSPGYLINRSPSYAGYPTSSPAGYSIPSSPVRFAQSVPDNAYYYPVSPALVSSPISYDNSNIWAENPNNNIWNNAPYPRNVTHSFNNDPAVQYVGSEKPYYKSQYRQLLPQGYQYPTPPTIQPPYANGYTGYVNPGYSYNMAMC